MPSCDWGQTSALLPLLPFCVQDADAGYNDCSTSTVAALTHGWLHWGHFWCYLLDLWPLETPHHVHQLSLSGTHGSSSENPMPESPCIGYRTHIHFVAVVALVLLYPGGWSWTHYVSLLPISLKAGIPGRSQPCLGKHSINWATSPATL